MKILKKNVEGITLIALVITIIVLLILAGVSISIVRGDDGILANSQKAITEYSHATILESMQMACLDYYAEKMENEESSLIEYLQKRNIIGTESINGGYKINTVALTGKKLSVGNGEDDDVYKLEPAEMEIGKIATISTITTISNNEKELNKTISYKIVYYGKDKNKNRELGILKDVTNTHKENEMTFIITYTDGIEDETIFADQTYQSSDEHDIVFNQDRSYDKDLPERKGYTFNGWNRAQNVQGNITYITYTAMWIKTYTVTYTDGVPDEVVFATQSYEVESGTATPKFKFNGISDAIPIREGYKFEGWAPTVAEIVNEDAVYEATWSHAE